MPTRELVCTFIGGAILLGWAHVDALPQVWVIDDGEKVKADAVALPLKRGIGNPVWAPGKPVTLMSLRNETVAVQVVIEADSSGLAAVTVDLPGLAATGGAEIRNSPGATDPRWFGGRPIERFVEHFIEVKRPTGSDVPRGRFGWRRALAAVARRAARLFGIRGKWTGFLPDALIPVEIAPAWAPYPLRIAPERNGIVWVDITVPRDQVPGSYRGAIEVRTGSVELARVPVVLEVVAATLPDRPIKTMLYYAMDELQRRMGSRTTAELHLWQLLHRHRMSALHSVLDESELARHLPALDGSLYTMANGYDGPAVGLGDGVLSLGVYGGYGAPDRNGLVRVESIAERLGRAGLFSTTDVFVYATDEDCGSPWGAEWMRLLAGSSNDRVRRVKVGWTCSTDPAVQPVSLVIMSAARFDAAAAARARMVGKEVWVYNGGRPRTGTFDTDAEAVSPRVNGWIAGMFDVGRWFYWGVTSWYDSNAGGWRDFDPFQTAETFHNNDGDYAQGNGVLLYPGRQVDRFTEHSIGFDGVIASIRLKNFRRGIQDAGIYQMALATHPVEARAIARGLLPRVLSEANERRAPSWSDSGAPFYEARMALLRLIVKG